jgi:hypothetical protein
MITGFFALVLAAPLALFGPTAATTTATTATCAAPVPSTTQPGYTVADPNCEIDGTPFTALPGARVHTGIVAGAAYRIEVPEHWNGRAHGYRGAGTTVYVDNPPLRAHYLADGFAWAASSYATNGYDVGQGVADSYGMIEQFRRVTGLRTRDVLMSGASMGGQVTAVMIEKHPKTFSGAMPMCGVLGDTSLFDYFLDANTTAAALTGVRISFPLHPADTYQDQWRAQVARMLPALGVHTGAPPTLTATGKTWSAVVERRTGGDRPGFDGAFAYWNSARSLDPLADLPFLFGLYPGLAGGTENIAAGNVTGNQHTFYRSADSRWPSATDWKLNATVLRVRPTVPPSRDLSGVPHVDDLFVPFSMEQIYAQRAAANGRAGLFVSRAIRGVGHCDFTAAELTQGFDDLVNWVDTGHRPAGDAILDRRAVASPTFGCRFTSGTHQFFVAPACPA